MLKRFLLVLLVVIAAVAGVWRLHKSRTFQLVGEIVPRVATRDSVVALTFDDGPVPGHTDSILALLQQAGARATFFVIGSAAAQYPDDVRRLMAAGHEIGNHSYSHQRLVLKSQAFIAAEIERTDSVLRAAGWRGPIHFRSPYGKKLVGLPLYLRRTGRMNISWDVEPETDPDVAGNAERIRAFVEERARPGSIILLHPWGRANAATRAALPGIIAGLQRRGYRFVTVSELLRTAHDGEAPT
jgi:peptidoglycan/xylan/chitin deacetylase (PgdA/CDA1 family)